MSPANAFGLTFLLLLIFVMLGSKINESRAAKRAYKQGEHAGKSGPGYRHYSFELPQERVYLVAALPRCPITTTLTPVLIDNMGDIWLMQADRNQGEAYELGKYYSIKKMGSKIVMTEFCTHP